MSQDGYGIVLFLWHLGNHRTHFCCSLPSIPSRTGLRLERHPAPSRTLFWGKKILTVTSTFLSYALRIFNLGNISTFFSKCCFFYPDLSIYTLVFCSCWFCCLGFMCCYSLRQWLLWDMVAKVGVAEYGVWEGKDISLKWGDLHLWSPKRQVLVANKVCV
jgi:hypothetical protein